MEFAKNTFFARPASSRVRTSFVGNDGARVAKKAHDAAVRYGCRFFVYMGDKLLLTQYPTLIAEKTAWEVCEAAEIMGIEPERN